MHTPIAGCALDSPVQNPVHDRLHEQPGAVLRLREFNQLALSCPFAIEQSGHNGECAGHPRLVVTGFGLHATNRLHNLYLNGSPKGKGTLKRVAFAFLNPLTLATVELSGRIYGGGVLKLEPSDCAHVMLPNMTDPQLQNVDMAAVKKVDDMLRNGDDEKASEIVGQTIAKVYGINRRDMEFAKRVYRRLWTRRGLDRRDS